jgi:fluoride exporter
LDYLLVGFGGVLGSLARFSIGQILGKRTGSYLPLGTFAVNISGALLLGIFISSGCSHNAALFFAEGFLGAFTTFSTFMFESFTLIKNNKKRNAWVYMAASLGLGLAGFTLGIGIGSLLTIC